MSDRRGRRSDRSSSPDDSLWEALEQSRWEAEVAEEVAETPVRQTPVRRTPARRTPLQQSPATAPPPLHQAQSAAPLRPQAAQFAPLMDFFREAARGTPARQLDFVDRQSAELAEFHPPVRPSTDSETPSPFIDRIRWESAPNNFREPRLPFYSGETDPISHLQAFEGAVALRSLSDALKCKLLVTTLDGQAREWFYELPPGTISSFAELRSELLLRFATSKKRKDGPAALFDIRQRDNESVARFVDRFQKEIQGVRNVNPDYYKVALIHGLREGPLKFKVTTKAPSTYQELIAIANRFIEGENANPTYISSLTAKAGGRDVPHSSSNNQYHSKPPRPDFHPPPQRGRNLRHKKPFLSHQQFHDQRLPLAAAPTVPLQALPILQRTQPASNPHGSSPMEELADLGIDFEEVAQIIQKKVEEKRQGPQRDWKPRDNSQFCNFHKEKGHLTKDCKALQKLVERLLAEGKLEDLGRKNDSSRPSTSKGKEVAEVHQECIEIRDEGHLGLIDIQNECIDVVDEGALGRLFFIHGGAGAESTRKSSLSRLSRTEVASTSSAPPSEVVTFGSADLPATANPFDDAIVVQAAIGNFTVDRILIDTGSSVNLLFKSTFEALRTGKTLLSTEGPLYGFSGERKEVEGSVTLTVTLGGVTKEIQFIVVDAPSSYHAIFGRPLLNKYRAIISTYHLAIKFCKDGRQCRVRSDPRQARECYLRTVNMTEVSPPAFPAAAEATPSKDAEIREGAHLEPAQVTQEVPIAEGEGRKLSINSELPEDQKAELISCLLENLDVFAWSAEDMPGVDPDVACHHLNVDPAAKPVQQKKRDVAVKLAEPIREEVAKLLKARFVQEIQYPEWVSNVVMVKKPGGKWRMCVDFTRLNKACPKDFYPLPRIDLLVDSAVGYPFMSFLDAFSGYHQIRMHKPDIPCTSFITNDGCYCYLVMPFGLKNAGATYQRMMDQVFKEQKGRNLEVYVDDLLIKSRSLPQHLVDLVETFSTLRRRKIKLNPLKCIFGASKGKFLGHLLTPEGLAPNPDKVKAILGMTPPRSPKEVQQLGGRLAGLGRFISRVGDKSAPFFKTLRGASKFQWTEECSLAFEQLKKQLTSTPLLQSPRAGETLFLYLGVGPEAVSSVLIREESRRQFPVYYVSHILKDAEARYPILEKLALALVMSARRLRPYFQAHSIQVVTDQPLKNVLEKPEHSGRLAKWAIELSEFEISYVPRTAIKAQVLADFMIDTTESSSDQAARSPLSWAIYVDGASGRNSSGAGVVLINPNGVKLEQAIKFYFPVTNNQAEYEALLAGLRLARELGIDHVHIKTDSLVMASQVLGNFETREPVLKRYLMLVKVEVGRFKSFTIEHIPRTENEEADVLAKYGLSSGGTTSELFRPAVEEEGLMQIDQCPSWMDPLILYLSTGNLHQSVKDKKKFRLKAAHYYLISDILYRKTFLSTMARCVSESEVPTILREVHSGECGSHSGARTLERRILRQGYFWPTMKKDSEAYARKCVQCQKFAPLQHQAAQSLRSITTPWPFAVWGMDLIGPFPMASGQRRFIVVMIDYFSKWIEAKALAKTTTQVVKNFIWGEIVCRHGIPMAIITDNGPQFNNAEMIDFCRQIGTELRFASVHHPRSNGQVEAANKRILDLLKKKVQNLKGSWADQLPSVLWTLRTTPSSATGETPFKLSHGSEALIPVEFEVLSPRVLLARQGTEDWLELNSEEMRFSLEHIEEVRDKAAIRQEEVKRRMARYFDKNVRIRHFQVGDLVLKKVDAAARASSVGKLNPSWAGPFIITEALQNGAYRLQTFEGEDMPHTWSGDDLKRFFS
ncbi:hypothetical protein KSP39_PZI001125 [Platanthera zijinensis]|uniref:Uncharacterized protein n=1 Tax=Platanthera zijinensis TaxID=2320716 RepID=A0AAP0GG66_9ASPA